MKISKSLLLAGLIAAGTLSTPSAALAQSKTPRLAATAPSAIRYFQLTINLNFGAIGEKQATVQTITTEVAIRGAVPGACAASMVSQVPTGTGAATKFLEVGTKFEAKDITLEGKGLGLHFVLSASRPTKIIKYTRNDGVEMEEPIITERVVELSVKVPLDQPKIVFDSSSKQLAPLKPLKGDSPAVEAAAGPQQQDQPIQIEITAIELK